jgi:hypothetical protein
LDQNTKALFLKRYLRPLNNHIAQLIVLSPLINPFIPNFFNPNLPIKDSPILHNQEA